jgi:hypothetical protein
MVGWVEHADIISMTCVFENPLSDFSIGDVSMLDMATRWVFCRVDFEGQNMIGPRPVLHPVRQGEPWLADAGSVV